MRMADKDVLTRMLEAESERFCTPEVKDQILAGIHSRLADQQSNPAATIAKIGSKTAVAKACAGFAAIAGIGIGVFLCVNCLNNNAQMHMSNISSIMSDIQMKLPEFCSDQLEQEELPCPEDPQDPSENPPEDSQPHTPRRGGNNAEEDDGDGDGDDGDDGDCDDGDHGHRRRHRGGSGIIDEDDPVPRRRHRGGSGIIDEDDPVPRRRHQGGSGIIDEDDPVPRRRHQGGSDIIDEDDPVPRRRGHHEDNSNGDPALETRHRGGHESGAGENNDGGECIIDPDEQPTAKKSAGESKVIKAMKTRLGAGQTIK